MKHLLRAGTKPESWFHYLPWIQTLAKTTFPICNLLQTPPKIQRLMREVHYLKLDQSLLPPSMKLLEGVAIDAVMDYRRLFCNPSYRKSAGSSFCGRVEQHKFASSQLKPQKRPDLIP